MNDITEKIIEGLQVPTWSYPSSVFDLLRESLDILKDMVDSDECQYDHHGNCQTHGWSNSNSDGIIISSCPHKRAKKLLERIR